MWKKLAAVGDNCMDVYDNLGVAYPGGNPVNVAVYFVRMGGEASYTGVVGTDTYGKLMKDSIEKRGVDVSHVEAKEGSTAITHVNLIEGERVFGEYEEGVLEHFKLTEAQMEFLARHELLVTALWGKVHGNLKQLKDRGVKVAFDAATRPESRIVEEALAGINYLFFASDNGDTPELRKLMQSLFDRGPELVIATLGSDGSLAYDGREFLSHGIVPCKVVDTMGAGDSYIAGFLKAKMDGKSIEECMEAGAENASITLGYQGAW